MDDSIRYMQQLLDSLSLQVAIMRAAKNTDIEKQSVELARVFSDMIFDAAAVLQNAVYADS